MFFVDGKAVLAIEVQGGLPVGTGFQRDLIEMERLCELIHSDADLHLYLPESFEWLILRSGLIDGKRIEEILEHPEDYVESTEYFSWERFFTDLLVDETKDSYLRYSKDKLNEAYLHDNERNDIIDAMQEVVQKGGFGTSVTPVSQFYFQQAF